MKIENREVVQDDYFSPVTYVPCHANGNANHPDSDKGVLIQTESDSTGMTMVLYCSSRTVKSTNPDNLVWG